MKLEELNERSRALYKNMLSQGQDNLNQIQELINTLPDGSIERQEVLDFRANVEAHMKEMEQGSKPPQP